MWFGKPITPPCEVLCLVHTACFVIRHGDVNLHAYKTNTKQVGDMVNIELELLQMDHPDKSALLLVMC